MKKYQVVYCFKNGMRVNGYVHEEEEIANYELRRFGESLERGKKSYFGGDYCFNPSDVLVAFVEEVKEKEEENV